MLHSAWEALGLLLQPFQLLMLSAGVLIGLSIGAVPGLGGIVGLAVMIPFTYGMETHAAFALLLGMAAVTTSSDLIPAILFGVPGSVGAAATTIDGHQMAKNGEAGRAFGAGFAASLFGGLVGAFVLAVSIPILQPVLLAIGSPELLAFSIFGLSMVATLSGRAPLKGLTAAALGLMLSMVGAGAQTGTMRWTGSWLYVWDGLPLVPVTLGLFAIPELADMAINRRQIAERNNGGIDLSSQWQGVRDVARNWWLVLRCSVIGTLLGTIPGIGSSVIDWIIYGYAQRSSRNAETFGTGDVRGVIAPESANNAKEGGHLVPTIAFGVPAGASMTLLLGAFLMHGLTPGPDMLTKNLDITYSIIWTLTLAHVLGAVICLTGSRVLAKLAEIRPGVMLPLIVPIVAIAAYQGSHNWGDLYSLFVFGLFGWIMKRLDWPRPPMVLGLVVGKIFERYLFISLQLYGWEWILRPVVIVVGLLIAWTLWAPMRKTAVVLWRQMQTLRTGRLRASPAALFSAFILAITIAALVTSSDWPAVEQIVPRTACWAALIAVSLNLLTELFGADRVEDPTLQRAHEAVRAKLPLRVFARRALAFFLAVAILVGMIALIGFIPAVAIFILVWMRYAFSESWRMSLASATIAALLCWAVFDQGLNVPWPQAALGDAVPWLRETTQLL
jgi:putative tricarboxylic transport membrane protein